jgi:sigma-B regulation protein RsbU (phosphoserine phosphatase)
MATGRYNGQPRTDPFLLPLSLGEFAPAARVKRGQQREDLELRVSALEQDRREVYQGLLEAAHVQRRLSGPRQIQRGRFDIASEVFPVRHLAGDFVSAIDVGARTWIALGDIAGKGIAAAMWFTHLVSLIRWRAGSETSPAAVVSAVNQNLCELRPTPPITTMILLCLDSNSGSLEYCNAGHPPALLVDRNAKVKRLETGGPILGVVNGAKFETERLAIGAGELLLGCSDGVLECLNRNDEEFGNDRFVRAAYEHAGEPAQAIVFSVLAALQDFAEDSPRQDDVSLLVIRHK